MIKVIVLVIFSIITGISYFNLSNSNNHLQEKLSQIENEVLLLPNGKALEALSFDYKTILANILWFNTISYFGKHYKGDQNYKWLAHMCKLVTDLDQKAEHAFEFCSLMLSWEVEDSKSAQELLEKAISHNSDKWRFYYLKGINELLFLKEPEKAKLSFESGAKIPNSPIFMTRLATKAMSGVDNPESAISFLKSMIARSKDPSEVSALKKHLKSTIHAYNLDRLEAKVKELKKIHNTIILKELIPNLDHDFVDPYGGSYYFDNETQMVKSTSGVLRAKTLVKK